MRDFVVWHSTLEMLEKSKLNSSLTRSLPIDREEFTHNSPVVHYHCNAISFSKCNEMPSLLDISPELFTQIFENCESFPELFAFILVCKRLYSVWSLNTGSIIQAVGERSIFAFDDALVAVGTLPCFLTR